ncbi:MAG: UvrD-helicase domain-containing protein [Bacilli bacterium]|nr:UvrD-helicase domain-containing protein [Bacilli bacterium]
MDFELSTYQKKILDEFKNSNDNLFISARAGASKTFMLVEISKLINTYSVFLAFNKVIQLELANRIKNPKFRTYTLNGLGYQILLKNAEEQEFPKITIDQYKTSNICRKIASSDIPEYKTYNWELKKECIDNLTILYELCKSCLYDIGDYNQLKEIIKEYNLFQEEVKEPLELTKIMNRIDTLNMYQFEHDGIISFSDQLYITVKKLQTKEWTVPGYLKFFNILIDEAQDNNAVQQQLIYYIRRKDSRIIAVGDKFQSIYGFNGSDKYAIDNFKRIYKMKELELPICYRCPKSHLRYVNKEFPNIGIQSAPFAKEGAIKIIDEEEIMNYVQTGDFILSRKNKNLCCIVLSLLEKGIPIYFKDAQFVEKIIKKVEKIEKKVNNIYELEEYIVREQQSSKDKLRNAVELFLDKGEEQAHQDMEKYNYSNEIVDLFDCILILLKNYLNKNKDKICTIQKFINYIREMLNTTERKNAVVCSSIHQAKGSETNNVFVLDEAKPAIYNFMTSDQIQQEKNLSYVALTRAKENLYLVVMPDEDEENEYNYSKFINKSNQTIDEFDADEDAGEYFDVELEDLLP